MKKVAAGIVVANQAFSLAKKAAKAFDTVIGDTIKSALNFRPAGDLATKQIEAMARNFELARARIGDAFIPVLQGVAQAINPMLEGFQRWAVANRTIIGSKILEWTTAFARNLVTGVGVGAVTVAKAWSGWGMIVNTVKLGIESFFEVVTAGTSKALDAMAMLAEKTGMSGVAASLRTASEAVSGLSDEFSRSGAASVAALERQSAELATLENRIHAVAGAIQDGIGVVAVKAQGALARSTAGTNLTLKEQADLQKLASKEQAKADADAIKSQVERVRAQQEAVVENAKAQAEAVAAGAMLVGQALGETFAAIASGSATAGDAFRDLGKTMIQAVAQSASQAIMAYAATAAAAQFAAGATLPGVGLILGAAAAAAAFAAVAAFATRFADGGLVTGGTPGKDSVPALLMPGELVVPVAMTRQLLKLAGKPDAGGAGAARMATGGMVRGGGDSSAGGTTINVHMQSFLPPDRAAIERTFRNDVEPVQRRINRLRLAEAV